MVLATRSPLSVSIVARSRETIDGLQSYLGRSGVVSHATRRLDGVVGVVATTTAIVLFPDDFVKADVERCVRALRTTRPRALLVMITAQPQQLSTLVGPAPRSPEPVVLLKPAFGWAILDAVREHADSR